MLTAVPEDRDVAYVVDDVIDAVLEWIGEGETFEVVMARHKVIMEDTDD